MSNQSVFHVENALSKTDLLKNKNLNRGASKHSRNLSVLSEIRSRNFLVSGMGFEMEDISLIHSFEHAILRGDLSECKKLLGKASVTSLLRLSTKLTKRISDDLKYFGYSAYVRFKTSYDVENQSTESIHIFVCQQSWMVHLIVELKEGLPTVRASAGLYISQPDGRSFVLTDNEKLRLDPNSIFVHMSKIGRTESLISRSA